MRTSNDRIGVLDGVRVLGVGIVAWFHFWEQNWLTPEIGSVSFEFIPRYGYLIVDMLILLSGFCLFLPYAKELVYGTGKIKLCVKEFYIKRFARIAPVYYFVIFFMLFAINIPENVYGDASVAADLVPHLFMVHNLPMFAPLETHLNGVMWTIATLVQLYLVFPVFVHFFSRKPLLTYAVLVSIGLISSWLILGNPDITGDSWTMFLVKNNTLSFFSVYANGMLGAWGYMQIKKNMEQSGTENSKGIIGVLAAALAIGCMLIYRIVVQRHEDVVFEGHGAEWHLGNRYMMSFLFLIFILCLLFSAKWFQKIFDNKVIHFLAGISMNYYIVHQYLAYKLRQLDIPPMNAEGPWDASPGWKWSYLAVVATMSLMLAILLTYLIERPCARWIKKHWLSRSENDK